MAWYVVNTLPNQERRAELNLRRQGYEVWMPSILRSRRHARRFETVQAPLFPSYIFVAIDADKGGWRSVNGTFGVRRLVSFGGHPAAVPEEFMLALRDYAQPDNSLSPEDRGLKPGDAVRLISGPFAERVGTLATLNGRQRVEVLLSVLGRRVTASVPVSSVVPAA